MENNESINSTSDSGRKVVAALVGVVLIILFVLAAKWTGDKIRERFSPTKPQPVAVIEQPKSDNNLLGSNTTNTATYSAIPKTGPNDWLYAVTGIMLLAGLGARKLANRIS